LTLRDQKVEEIESYAITQNLQSLRNRVNELGVSEPLVQRLGRSRIVVDLPGVQDSADAKRILNKFANLEFRLVAKPNARPSETETYPYEGRDVVLERRNIVTGDRVTGAQQDYDPENNMPQVSINLDGAGGDRMHDATKDNVGNQMAILFKELKPRSRLVMRDGQQVVENYSVEEKRLINVATIRSALGYRFRITGVGLGEARDLALLLRAGALAAPMYIVEERTVGASLGEENIREGTAAGLIGLLLVVAFMVIIYKVFGILANVALVVNITLLVAVMSVLGATLTMPGIAGIVLTMGMAVDSNIIIFARIKEELHTRGIQAAIENGFDRAFLTIFDANLTTFIIAVILFAMGSGPVKGFAVTLAIGIVTTVFTAVTVTRALVNLTHGGRNLKKLYI
jgi:preprotein translocase subunit SecD